MDSRLTRWCDAFLEACWLVAILATPLFFNIHSERVFEPDKIALLRSLAILMSLIWVVRFLDNQGWRNLDRLRFTNKDAIWHKPLVIPVLTLVVVYILSTIFSINSRISWAGSYQRMQGLYTTLSYVVIFALMVATIRSHEQVRRIVSVLIVTSIPVALYGLLQHFGHDPLPWGGDVQARVAGHMGNAIFIAAYLIMVIPLTLARIVDAFNNILSDAQPAAADIARSSIYIFILAIQLLTLYWSGSRGPLIGLGVGLFSFLLVFLVSLRDAVKDHQHHRLKESLSAMLFISPSLVALLAGRVISENFGALAAFSFFIGVVGLSVLALFIMVSVRRGWRWLWLGWILLTVVVAGWLLLFNVPSERTAGLRNIPLLGSVFDTLDEWRDLPVIGSYGRMLDPTNTTGREKSGRVRVLIWEGVVDLISPHEPLQYPDGHSDPFNWLRPLLGYGPESMYSAYNRFYPPELATVEARNASPDRSHNETFDTLAITGLAGLVAWQFLYLSVILFAFRYLGVVRSGRDMWVLVGLWIGGALLAVFITLTLFDPVYVGVAVPTGVVLGVIVYLIYYALFGKGSSDGDESFANPLLPFAADRLLMNALIAGVLAHYVEIHFGIAISVTRLYFFVFVALMFALGYRLRHKPSQEESTVAPVMSPSRGDKRKRRPPTVNPEPESRPVLERLATPALLLTLMLVLLGYGFVTYALPPGKVITGPSDLSAVEIFRQSLLQNSRKDFVEWPFVMSMIVLSFSLGWLVFLSEMAKNGEIQFMSNPGPPAARRRITAVVLAMLAMGGLLVRSLTSATSATAVLGVNLALIAAVGYGIAALLLLLNRPFARLIGGIVGIATVIMAFPVLISGGGLSFAIMAIGGGLTLWLLWDRQWRQSLLPAGGAIMASLTVGIALIFLHAVNYRSLLFYRGGETVDSVPTLRALEATQAGDILISFYFVLITITVLLAFSLCWSYLFSGRRPGTNISPVVAYGTLALAFLSGFFLISQTNLHHVQADMIFKRARPFDDQASRATQGEPGARQELWDTAIAIYSSAINRNPSEDFYYLFLGRAYLERAAITTDPAEQADLLDTAERLLKEAQRLNPLNTDHTANLARLNTRWYAAIDDEVERQERLSLAENYYNEALILSPQNSVIRNELARLILELRGDCDRALALYDESAAIDPFYAQTHLARADAYILCAGNRSESDRDSFYRSATDSLELALEISPGNIRGWIQLAEVHRQLGEFEQANRAIEEARRQNDPVIFPPSEIDFLAAQIAVGLGQLDRARQLAEGALESAGPETTIQIESFLAGLGE